MMVVMSSDETQSEDLCNHNNAFTPVFLVLTVGGIALSVHLYSDIGTSLIGMLLICTVAYSFAVTIFTFQGDQIAWRPFCFTCPIVVGQYPRLLKWHGGLLTLFLVCETIGLQIFPPNSNWWSTPQGKSLSPIGYILGMFWILATIFASLVNRGILNQAHRDHFEQWPTEISS